jgi:DNA-binding MarR family transcriptional regulator
MGLFHEKFSSRFRQETICESSLKKNHKKIINILYQHDKITLTEIGKLLDIEKGSLTTLIDVLEEEDFVIRLNDPADRRKTLISLSPKGKEEMEQVIDFLAQRMKESLNKFDPKEIQKFQMSLQYVVDFMNKI